MSEVWEQAGDTLQTPVRQLELEVVTVVVEAPCMVVVERLHANISSSSLPPESVGVVVVE